MNSFEGMPITGDNYDWTDQNGKRYMSLREGKTVPKLMSAGVFHIGFAPNPDYPIDPPPGDGLSKGAIAGIIVACVVVGIAVILITIFCVRRAKLRKSKIPSDTMHEEGGADKRDSFIQT